MFRTIACLLLVLCSLAVPAGAQDTRASLVIAPGPFAGPSMHFDHDAGAFVWDRRPIMATFAASGSAGPGHVWLEDVRLVPEGAGGQALELRMPSGQIWSDTGAIILPRAFLAPYAARFADLCRTAASTRAVLIPGQTMAFSFTRAYRGPVHRGVPARFQAAATVILPVTISCAAMPAEPRVS